MAENINNNGIDLSAFNISTAPPAPDNTSEPFYRADPVKVDTPAKPVQVFDNFQNIVNDISANTPIAPTKTIYYPKELTEKYKGTAAYSPWMDPYADNESVAAKNWGMWDAIGTGFSGMLDNALHAGKQYAMFYPRLGRAIVGLDASLLNPTEAEYGETAQELKEIQRKHPIFYDPGSNTDDIFSRQFLAETLQSTGFTFGTMGAFVAENAVFGGMGKILPALFKIGAASKSVKLAEIGADAINLGKNEINLTEQTRNLLQNGPAGRLGSRSTWDNLLKAGSKLPFLDGLSDAGQLMRVGAKSGLTTGELTMIGLGGLRRGISEWNFASSESVVEAGGVYGDIYDMLYDKYEKAGVEITPEIQDQIRKDAMSAATKDYAINVAILGVSNKIMFNNLFRNFGTDSKFINLLTKQGERTISVMGTTEGGKALAKSLPRSFLGVLGHKKEIIGVIGKKGFRRELGKDIIRGLSRFEINEGIQENLQEGTSVALKKYYSNLYDRGIASWGDSFAEGIESQFSKTGFKTFLSGALMGFFTRPVTGAIQSAKESFDQYRAKKGDPNHVDALSSSLKSLNDLYANPENVLLEPIRAIKEQTGFNKEMARAAAQGEKYDYFNNHDSAIIKNAIYAKNTGTFETFKEFIKAYSTSYTEKEFKEATGIDVKDTKYGSVQAYTDALVNQLDRYSELHDKYTDMYSNQLSLSTLTSDPYRKQRYAFNQIALRNAISIVAFNESKAQASTMRAADISRKVSQIEGIGGAAASTFNTVTDYYKAQDNIRILNNELRILKESPDKTEETKRAIANKEEEIKHLTEYNKLAYQESVDKDGEKVYLPRNVRALSAKTQDNIVNSLVNYYTLKNKQNGITVPIKIQDVKKVLNDLNDYQKLSSDTKEYIDAVNLLSDPNRFTKFAINHRSASVAAFAKVAYDTYKELEGQSGVFEKYLKDNPEHLNTLLSIANSPFNAYDSMDVVLKSIENINSLSEEQNKKDIEDYEKTREESLNKLQEDLDKFEEDKKKHLQFIKSIAGVNMATLSEKDKADFISKHYYLSDDEKSFERSFISPVTNKPEVTHTIDIKAILKDLKRDAIEDVPENELFSYLVSVEQDLWQAENPGKPKPETNSGNRAKTVSQTVKKIKNLVGQKVSVKGRKATIVVEDNTYYLRFDDDKELDVPLGDVEEEPIVFNWETDPNTGNVIAYEADPEKFITLDDYPEITLLSDNLTEKEQEITGVTRDSKVVRINDISHNVEYVNEDDIIIDGKHFKVTREEETGKIIELQHGKGKRNITYSLYDTYTDPKGLAAEHISLAEYFYLQHNSASDISEDEIDAMLQQIDNESGLNESDIVGKKTIAEQKRLDKIEEVISDMTPEQYSILDQIMVAKNNSELENIPIDDRNNLKNWALDAIKKLSKLDALEEVVFLTDLIINPLSKANNEFNNRDSSTSRVNKKESKTAQGPVKTGTTADTKGSTSKVERKTIEGAAGDVEKMYDKKEVKVELGDLISTQASSLFTIRATDKAKSTYKFTKKSYKENLSNKREKPETDPFEDTDLLTCFN